ncbi:MAG TPA: hypothetical protein DIU15_07100 [Deltaproteobacteria bacterium]|nr:hypothetical protein [Deltaproteobacteria bacterium]HCP45790.1 hypothetical protein [Deltaproteobacteria bacterium]
MAASEVMDWTIWGDGSTEVIDWPNLGEVSPTVLRCPNCGLHVTLFVDTSAGSQSCTERCPLCLRAIALSVVVADLQLASIQATRPY